MEPYSTLEIRYDQSGAPYTMIEARRVTSEGIQLDDPKFIYRNEGSLSVQPNRAENVPQQRLICGIQSRSFYSILALIILIVAGASAGGIAGGLLSRQNAQNNENLSPDSNNISPILTNSSIAASSLINAEGHTIRSVFFQDDSGAIIMRQWDSQTTTWKTRNLTNLLILDTDRPSISTYHGAPLAAASFEFEAGDRYTTGVWFLTPENGIQLVDSRYSTFTENDININILPSEIYAAAGSGLAAAWQGCPYDCWGAWIVTFQDRHGQISIANGSGNWHIETSLEGTVANGSSMAIVPQQGGSGLTNLSLVSETLPSSTATNIQLYSVSQGTDWQIEKAIMVNLPFASSALQLAGTTLSNYTERYFLALLPNNTVAGCVSNGSETISTHEAIDFSSGPSINFSSIATTLDARFYGISNGAILEYQIDSSNPGIFNYVGIVFP